MNTSRIVQLATIATSLAINIACSTQDLSQSSLVKAGRSLKGMLGFHDCNATGSDATPKKGTSCDNEWKGVMNQLGGGWLTIVGHYDGANGQPATDRAALLDLSSVPSNVKVVLRIEQIPGSSAPRIVNEATDYDMYASGLVKWLKLPDNKWRPDLVEYFQLGNEFEQTADTYSNWHLSGSERYLELGVGPCHNPHGVAQRPEHEKYIQMYTPERYAKYFIAVRKALDGNGFRDKKLMLFGRMPEHWWWHGQYMASTKTPDQPDFRFNNQEPCMAIYRTIGDYLLAIEKEAKRRGYSSDVELARVVGGISIHFQGVRDQANAANWFASIQRGIRETSTVRNEVKDNGNKIEHSAWATSSIQPRFYKDKPLFINEIHPQPPFWQLANLGGWMTDFFTSVRTYNTGIGASVNPVKMISFYRWGAHGASVQDGNKSLIINKMVEANRD